MYKLICMTFDGEYKTETNRGELFPSVDAAWEYANDMGSRWFFYPFCFVVSASGKAVVDAPEFLLSGLKGKRVSTVVKLFNHFSKLEKVRCCQVTFSFIFLSFDLSIGSGVVS